MEWVESFFRLIRQPSLTQKFTETSGQDAECHRPLCRPLLMHGPYRRRLEVSCFAVWPGPEGDPSLDLLQPQHGPDHPGQQSPPRLRLVRAQCRIRSSYRPVLHLRQVPWAASQLLAPLLFLEYLYVPNFILCIYSKIHYFLLIFMMYDIWLCLTRRNIFKIRLIKLSFIFLFQTKF